MSETRSQPEVGGSNSSPPSVRPSSPWYIFPVRTVFTVSIFNDAGPGGTPGTALESFPSVEGTPDTTTDVTLTSIAHPALLSGDNYFLVVFASSNAYGGWTGATNGALNFTSLSDDGGATWPTYNTGYQQALAFEIDGTVPEPVSLSLVALGSIAFLGCRCRA